VTGRDIARETILARIRDALGPEPHVPGIPRAYTSAGHLDAPAVIERFAERVDDYRATVHHTDHTSLPARLATIVATSGATRIGVPAGLDPDWLTDLPEHLEVVHDHPDHDTAALDTLDLVITGSAVGIAETGTIVLDASPDQGRRALTLVPDHHLCVIMTDAIVETVPEGVARLEPTRPLTMISGPSATSDIELDRVEGVHGPRTLDVIVVGTSV
jgi:L-lactate dehydrogenase complex protein LldG